MEPVDVVSQSVSTSVAPCWYFTWFAQHPLRETIHSGIPAAGLIPIFVPMISRSLTAEIASLENRFSLPQHRISVTRWRMSSFGNPLPFA